MPRNDELVQASLAGDLETVKRLIESGADPNSVDQHGMGPLLNFHPEVTRYLLEHGADPTIRDADKETPLSWASWYLRDKSVIDQLWYEGSGVVPDFSPSETGSTWHTEQYVQTEWRLGAFSDIRSRWPPPG